MKLKCSTNTGYHCVTVTHTQTYTDMYALMHTHAHKHTCTVSGIRDLASIPASPFTAAGPKQCTYTVHIKCQYEAKHIAGTHNRVTIQHINKLQLSVSISRRNYHPTGSIHETGPEISP